MKACCKKEENLIAISNENFQRCKICNSRHFSITAEIGELGVQLSGLGVKSNDRKYNNSSRSIS